MMPATTATVTRPHREPTPLDCDQALMQAPIVRATLAIGDLMEYPNWVVWRYERQANGKWTKVPYSPCYDGKASSTNPRSWGTFTEAVQLYQAHKDGPQSFAGLGFMLSGSPFAMVDLDHCIDPQGKLSPFAHAMVAQFDSYTEITPSGSGLRIIVRAADLPNGVKTTAVELYTKARFMTVTGKHLVGTLQVIHERTAELTHQWEVLRQRSATEKPADATRPPACLQLDWGYVRFLATHMDCLIAPNGIPYGATKQITELLLYDQLPTALAGKGDGPSERRCLVVCQLARMGYYDEEIYVISRYLWQRYGYDSKPEADLRRDMDYLLFDEAPKYRTAQGIHPKSVARRAAYRNEPPIVLTTAALLPKRIAAYLDILYQFADADGIVAMTIPQLAEYTGFDVRTIQRYERALGAKVHRVALLKGRTSSSQLQLVGFSGDKPCTPPCRHAALGDEIQPTVPVTAADPVLTPQIAAKTSLPAPCISENTLALCAPSAEGATADEPAQAQSVFSPAPVAPSPATALPTEPPCLSAVVATIRAAFTYAQRTTGEILPGKVTMARLRQLMPGRDDVTLRAAYTRLRRAERWKAYRAEVRSLSDAALVAKGKAATRALLRAVTRSAPWRAFLAALANLVLAEIRQRGLEEVPGTAIAIQRGPPTAPRRAQPRTESAPTTRTPALGAHLVTVLPPDSPYSAFTTGHTHTNAAQYRQAQLREMGGAAVLSVAKKEATPWALVRCNWHGDLGAGSYWCAVGSDGATRPTKYRDVCRADAAARWGEGGGV